MNTLRKMAAIFLAATITLTFMPAMVFAEEADGEAGEDMYEPSNVWMLFSKEDTDAQQTDDVIKVGLDYVFTGHNIFESVISENTPITFESYFMLEVEKDTYRILQPEDIFVTDIKGNIVDCPVTKADGDVYGRIQITFKKAGKYLICCEEEREGVKIQHYPAEIKAMDDAYIDSAVKQLKIKGVSVTSKKGSQTIKWKDCDYVSCYAIYRSTNKASGYKKVATVKGNKTSYTFKKGLKKGKKYYYKVVGFRDTLKVATKYSNIVSATAK